MSVFYVSTVDLSDYKIVHFLKKACNVCHSAYYMLDFQVWREVC